MRDKLVRFFMWLSADSKAETPWSETFVSLNFFYFYKRLSCLKLLKNDFKPYSAIYWRNKYSLIYIKSKIKFERFFWFFRAVARTLRAWSLTLRDLFKNLFYLKILWFQLKEQEKKIVFNINILNDQKPKLKLDLSTIKNN